MAVVRKKQDDKYLLALRELVASGSGGNRQCFDCGQKGPTYVNMTIGSFVCTRCSGVLRGLTPPHRVKSISMATFTQDEIDFLRSHGNELCAKTWLGLWDPKRAVHQQEQRELMMDKYERKRYYLEPASPLKSLANAVNLKSSAPATNHIQNGHHNGYASIHLTPPAAQRTSANGLQKMANSGSNSSSSISRPHHHHHHHAHNSQNNNHDAFGLSGGLSSLNSAGSTSTGALSDTSSCASNGFGADSDFVADFGSANIFDATSARSTGSPAVSSVSSVGSSNGYAKVQPLRAAHLQQQQQLQQQQHQHQQQQQLLNGNGHLGTENFADFDHAPIFNAVGAPLQNGHATSPPKNGSTAMAPSEDRYAALKDLDEQLRELKASETATEAPTPTNGNGQATDAFGGALNNNPNPFKGQQQQQLSSQVVNPFQQQQQQHQNLYGQLTLIPNAYGSSPQQQMGHHLLQQQQQQSFFNFNNNNGFAISQGLPNGCGFGSMQPAPVMANNPFAASGAMNTNNPFL